MSEAIENKLSPEKYNLRRTAVAVGVVAVAALTPHYGPIIEAAIRGEHAKETVTTPLSKDQRVKLDTGARWSAKRLLDDNAPITDRHIAVENGRLVVGGSEEITSNWLDGHVKTVRGRGGQHYGTNHTTITFTSAPRGNRTDPTSVDAFLAGQPHVLNIELDREGNVSQSYVLGVTVGQGQRGLVVSVERPTRDSQVTGEPNKAFYDLPIAEQAETIVYGERPNFGVGDGYTNTFDEANKRY